MSRPPAPPSLSGLFLGFLTVGLFGFGGVLPWARRMIVEQKRWMSATDFTDLLALCQFLPGGNIMNLTIALGSRFHGIPGAVLAFVGLMAAPVTIVIGLGLVYDQFAQVPVVRHGFAGLAAAASALVLSSALKIAAPLRHQPLAVAIATVTCVGIAVLRLPLLWVLAVMATASTLLMARSGR